MTDISNFLFSGSTPAAATGTTSQTTNYPDWFNQATGMAVQNAATLASLPGGTPNQQQATSIASNAPQRSNQLINQGADATAGAIAQPFNQQNFNSFLSPYLSGANSEIGSLQSLAKQNLTEDILPSISGSAIGAGIYGGGSANGVENPMNVADDRAIRDSNTSLLQSEGGVLNNAYNSAMGAYQTGVGQQLAGGAQLGNLGGALTASKTQDVNNLMNTGAIPYQQSQFFTNTLGASRVPTTVSSSSTQPMDQTIAQLGGGAGGALSGVADVANSPVGNYLGNI